MYPTPSISDGRGGRLVAPFLRVIRFPAERENAPRVLIDRADVGPSCVASAGGRSGHWSARMRFSSRTGPMRSSSHSAGAVRPRRLCRLRHGNLPFPRTRPAHFMCSRCVSRGFGVRRLRDSERGPLARAAAIARAVIRADGPRRERDEVTRLALKHDLGLVDSRLSQRPAPLSGAQPARLSRLDPARRLHVHAVHPPHQPAHGLLAVMRMRVETRRRSRNSTTNTWPAGSLGRFLPGHAAPGVSATRSARGELDWQVGRSTRARSRRCGWSRSRARRTTSARLVKPLRHTRSAGTCPTA